MSLTVRFFDCGRGGLVRFECSNPSDFRIEADGVVYAARSLQLSGLRASPLLIKASDDNTQQQWVTQVQVTPSAPSSQQVNKPQQLFYNISDLFVDCLTAVEMWNDQFCPRIK